MLGLRGEYHHFRCDRHEVEGHIQSGKVATYRCEVRGCGWPAKAYWYKGEQYQTLPVPIPRDMIAYV